MTVEEMVEKFQCPGCVVGSDTQCGKFKLNDQKNSCASHCMGMRKLGVRSGRFALGLPKGFNRASPDTADHSGTLDIEFYPKGVPTRWDHLNVPVWAMEEDGFLFVRTYSPRINWTRVEVLEGGTFEAFNGVPHFPINVATFIEEID